MRRKGGGTTWGSIAWYAALGVGVLLVVVPDPLTTIPGLLIVGGMLGVEVVR